MTIDAGQGCFPQDCFSHGCKNHGRLGCSSSYVSYQGRLPARVNPEWVVLITLVLSPSVLAQNNQLLLRVSLAVVINRAWE